MTKQVFFNEKFHIIYFLFILKYALIANLIIKDTLRLGKIFKLFKAGFMHLFCKLLRRNMFEKLVDNCLSFPKKF